MASREDHGSLGSAGDEAAGGDSEWVPEVSVVVPATAGRDHRDIHLFLDDLERYGGPYDVETIVVLNNDPESEAPPGLDALELRDVTVVPMPRSPRKAGEADVMAARMAGVAAARSEIVVNFDADCRVPNVTALLNWYVGAFHEGADAAYTRVGHHDYVRVPSVLIELGIHHLARWFERVVLRVPTTRGGNYAVRRDLMLDVHGRGLLSDDLSVGSTFKKLGGSVSYASRPDLRVLTSGRVYEPGWSWMFPDFLHRLRRDVLPARDGAPRVTARANDVTRRYRDSGPITADDR